jgi:hypothetical protein
MDQQDGCILISQLLEPQHRNTAIHDEADDSLQK